MTKVDEIEEVVVSENTVEEETVDEETDEESLKTDDISDESDDEGDEVDEDGEDDQMNMFQNLMGGGVDTDKLDELVDTVSETNQKLDVLIELMKALVQHTTGGLPDLSQLEAEDEDNEEGLGTVDEDNEDDEDDEEA